MNVQITKRHDRHLSQETKDFIVADVEALQRFHDGISSAHVILDKVEHKSGPEDIVEIIINAAGANITAKTSNQEENMVKAFDETLSKVARQLKKKNEKEKSHN
ncbi:ribosome hibernation-promoting factor, HPF/YfiA family [Chitinivibrio alkaliphilus]|uniref:Ribosome-associated inhibitor A n=1 Tax=Chitinivibrio alkaliphilus ACht1 TaxID=1313304 RepID=U7D6K8_9BACT|nr:ribosome-associated translation inhibitor RaiA [Chitinivibrio alkaliphilus]ERP31573.1 ribosome-associated inhibitor A [Chitinivibrio alkaliphilus ACht1]